jgi:hypothetical protein
MMVAAHMTPVATRRGLTDPHRTGSRDLGEALAAHIDHDGVVFPIEAAIITARPRRRS